MSRIQLATAAIKATAPALLIKAKLEKPYRDKKVCGEVHLKQAGQFEASLQEALVPLFERQLASTAKKLRGLASDKAWHSAPLVLKKTRDYSCLMLEMPDSLAKEILSIGLDRISDEDLTADGRETWPHITVLYGLHTEKADEVLAPLKDFGPINFTLRDISRFEGADYDVVKIDIESRDLMRLRKLVEDNEHTSTHPEYHPHITLAYVKKDVTGYAGECALTGLEFTGRNLVFSSKNETKTQMFLDGNGEQLPFTKNCGLLDAKAASYSAESLAGKVFDPAAWDAELINRALPIFAQMACKAAVAQMKVMGVNLAKLIKVEKSTASEWLANMGDDDEGEDGDDPFAGFGFDTPFGVVDMKIATEMPTWMKEKIKQHVEETFQQNYWPGMNQTTADDIQNYLKLGISEGWSIRRMADSIQTTLGGGDYAGWRARNIARTESGHALNGARSVSADALVSEMQEVGLPIVKSWLSVLGTTTRRTHANLDGVPANKEGLWMLAGIKTRWPGDVRLPASERCNCQCTIIVDFGIDDDTAQELIDDYTERAAEKAWQAKNCGTGSGGFKPGNTCAGGGGGGPVKEEGTGHYIPGAVGHIAGVDTSAFTKGKVYDQWAMQKIHSLEKMYQKGEWDKLAAAKTLNYTHYEKQGPVAKAVIDAKNNLLKKHEEELKTKEAVPVATAGKWEKVGDKLGTEAGGVYMYKGEKYYVKIPDDVNRAKNEVLTMKLYELAGAHAKQGELVEIDGKVALAAKWVDASKADWSSQEVKNKAAGDFAVHAWLNNRDAVGAGSENPMANIMQAKDGKLIAVDVGGALQYQGMGGGGKKQFGVKADEWDGMRQHEKNPSMAKVFGNMTPQQLVDSAQKLKGVSDQAIKDLVDKHGPGTAADKQDVTLTLIARKYDIISRADKLEAALKPPTPTPAPAPTPPKPAPTPTPATAGTGFPAMPKLLNPLHQKGYDSIKELAEQGDLKALKTLTTSTGTPAAKQFHDYKLALISHLESNGGKAKKQDTTEAKPKPKPEPAKPEPIKIDATTFPPVPTFKDANFAAGNLALANKALDLAKAGDLEGLKAMSIPNSGKLSAFHNQLIDNVAKQLNPPMPPKKLAESLDKITQHVKNASPPGVSKIGYWTVHADVGGIPQGIPQGAWDESSTSLFAQGTKVATKAGIKDAVKTYTGGAYHSVNIALRADDHTSTYGSIGKKIGVGIVEKGMELPPGQILGRKHYLGAADIAALKPGLVVSDKGVLSTSTAAHVWTGNVHWHMTVSPGVKGIPAKNFSNHSSESEVVLAPNQKVLVTHIEETGNSYGVTHNIHAVLLPTEPGQCC